MRQRQRAARMKGDLAADQASQREDVRHGLCLHEGTLDWVKAAVDHVRMTDDIRMLMEAERDRWRVTDPPGRPPPLALVQLRFVVPCTACEQRQQFMVAPVVQLTTADDEAHPWNWRRAGSTVLPSAVIMATLGVLQRWEGEEVEVTGTGPANDDRSRGGPTRDMVIYGGTRQTRCQCVMQGEALRTIDVGEPVRIQDMRFAYPLVGLTPRTSRVDMRGFKANRYEHVQWTGRCDHCKRVHFSLDRWRLSRTQPEWLDGNYDSPEVQRQIDRAESEGWA